MPIDRSSRTDAGSPSRRKRREASFRSISSSGASSASVTDPSSFSSLGFYHHHRGSYLSRSRGFPQPHRLQRFRHALEPLTGSRHERLNRPVAPDNGRRASSDRPHRLQAVARPAAGNSRGGEHLVVAVRPLPRGGPTAGAALRRPDV